MANGRVHAMANDMANDKMYSDLSLLRTFVEDYQAWL